VELRERVFDPFFTRREGGIGLGLTIVQQIVQVHQGEIWMTESPWGGACFNIRFDSYDGSNEL
jgi:signal transduction histidine kinase